MIHAITHLGEGIGRGLSSGNSEPKVVSVPPRSLEALQNQNNRTISWFTSGKPIIYLELVSRENLLCEQREAKFTLSVVTLKQLDFLFQIYSAIDKKNRMKCLGPTQARPIARYVELYNIFRNHKQFFLRNLFFDHVVCSSEYNIFDWHIRRTSGTTLLQNFISVCWMDWNQLIYESIDHETINGIEAMLHWDFIHMRIESFLKNSLHKHSKWVF